jgi:hypothetical protein
MGCFTPLKRRAGLRLFLGAEAAAGPSRVQAPLVNPFKEAGVGRADLLGDGVVWDRLEGAGEGISSARSAKSAGPIAGTGEFGWTG